jgi:hypothetical protein
MPEGFEVLNENGTIRNSYTSFFGKILGQQTLGTALLEVKYLAWPYPDVPSAQRAVFCVSNRTWVDNQNSTAYAVFTDATRGTIMYSQDMDRLPITVIFAQY